MKKFIFALSAFILSSSTGFAGDAKLTWGKFETFTDVYPSHETRPMFYERIEKEFGSIFSGFAKKRLPEGYQLEVTVTDLDLAGDIHAGRVSLMYDIRVMREIYWPRMDFSYELKNEKGDLVKSGVAKLNDMDYLHHARFPSGNTTFEFEERMIGDWFKKNFAATDFVANNVKMNAPE